jgi:gamma-glutamylcyclotransferase (GGCT)/AIG2-like uncharacterized protein YtfP
MLYAAYGSNLHPFRLLTRLPASRFLGTAAIAGKKLRFHKRGQDGSGKCNIIAGDGRIHVAVYEFNAQEKDLLDRIEGADYFAETIEVPGFGECFTYVAPRSYTDNRLRPYSWYKQLVLVGCEALEFPIDYIGVIGNVAAIDDPDKERSAANMRLVERARKAC